MVHGGYGSQAVVWQTAVNPVIALELMAGGVDRQRRARAGGVDARPFLDLLADYGAPWACEERAPIVLTGSSALNT